MNRTDTQTETDRQHMTNTLPQLHSHVVIMSKKILISRCQIHITYTRHAKPVFVLLVRMIIAILTLLDFIQLYNTFNKSSATVISHNLMQSIFY